MNQPESAPPHAGDPRFTTTHWSMVVAAGRDTTGPSREALESLCKAYWQPLYFFLRQRGSTVEDAEDLIQGFFTRVLEKGIIALAERGRGKFRTLLLTSLVHYVADQRKRDRALKRGGGQVDLSLDIESAERRYLLEPSDDLTPDKVYARRWVVVLLDRALLRLRETYAGRGQDGIFESLKGALTGEDQGVSYREIAKRLGMTEGAVKMAVHRMRERFVRCLREEIAQTVTSPGEIDEEMQCLRSFLSQ